MLFRGFSEFSWVSGSAQNGRIKLDDFACPQLYSVQPLCLCRCLHKQPLPNSDLAYFSNMCNFRETDVNTSLYLMSAPTCRRFRWPWYSKKVVVHKSNKYSMGPSSDLWPNLVSFICIHKQSGWTLHSQSGSIDMSLAATKSHHDRGAAEF